MEKVRIQDDLYTFVNGEKIEQMVIPGDQPSIGAFQSIAIDVEKTMLNEFKEMCENDTYPNEYLKRACALYKAAKNVDKKAADGITPALKALSALNNVTDFVSFGKCINL